MDRATREEAKMDEKTRGNWINVGKLDDFLAGKKELVLYINTVNLIWFVGVIVNG